MASPPPSDTDDIPPSLFADPPDFYPPSPPPTHETHTLTTLHSPLTLALHLVGHSPLEAHTLWNGARFVSDFFEADPRRIAGLSVVELGAGAGLPALTARVLGARTVVVSDFPDPDIVGNMWRNVELCEEKLAVRESQGEARGGGRKIVAEGFVWGADPETLLRHLDSDSDDASKERGTDASSKARTDRRFDVLILADLLFRHSEHGKLVKTILETMRRPSASTASTEADLGGVAYVFFTSYRPWLAHKDLAFFDICREKGLMVKQVVQHRTERPLFEDDPGDEEVRRTVTGFEVRWPVEGQGNGDGASDGSVEVAEAITA